MEIGAKAERQLDPRFTRRLMQLELSDVEVPPPPSDFQQSWSALFYRVLATEPGSIRVELWERGEFHGARTVNVVRGSSRFHARRIALAAAELARGLRHKRLAEASEPKKPDGSTLGASEAEHARLALGAGVRSALLGAGEVWLLGPSLDAQLRFESGARLDLGSAWLFGNSPRAGRSVQAVWRELVVAPAYGFRLGDGLDFVLGVSLAAAVVHVSGALAVDDMPSSQDTWSARSTIDLGVEVDVSRTLELSLTPELGVVLRPVPVEDTLGARQRWGGSWIGASLTASFDRASGTRQ